MPDNYLQNGTGAGRLEQPDVFLSGCRTGARLSETAMGSNASLSLSVIVPVYNSEQILPRLIERLAPVLASLTDAYEVILVNDSSRDRSWDVIQELASRNRWVRGLNLMRNYGQHNALLCGIRVARHEIVVTMDDDLQHRPEEIPTLLAKMREGF